MGAKVRDRFARVHRDADSFAGRRLDIPATIISFRRFSLIPIELVHDSMRQVGNLFETPPSTLTKLRNETHAAHPSAGLGRQLSGSSVSGSRPFFRRLELMSFRRSHLRHRRLPVVASYLVFGSS